MDLVIRNLFHICLFIDRPESAATYQALRRRDGRTRRRRG